MKLTHGLTAALAGLASAAGAQQSAQVYFLSSSKSAPSQSPASISASLARLIFLQRLSPFGEGPSALDVTDGTQLDDVVDAMNRFGKAPPPIIASATEHQPKQLVVLLEDMTTKQMTELRNQINSVYKGMRPAFEIPNPPPSRAHDDLVDIDFYNAATKGHTQCDLDQLVNLNNEKCWGEDTESSFARYNVEKEGKVPKKLDHALKMIRQLPEDRSVQVMIVALPAIDTSAVKSWRPEELCRRQAEEVMTTIDSGNKPAKTSKTKEHDFFISTKSKKPVPACFSSQDSCITGTGNCSGHGQCQNRYAKPDGSDGKTVCYSCHCLSTVSDSGSLTHWAGNACTKKDISTPFWLFAGFTIVLLGILTLGIGMLFSVGEETLPGVIGAGVSRPSK